MVKMAPRMRLSLMLAIATVIFFFYWAGSDTFNLPRWRSQSSWRGAGTAGQDEHILKNLKLSRDVEYRRYCIDARQKSGLHRQKLVNVSVPLLTDARMDFTGDELGSNTLLPCQRTVRINVPKIDSASTDTSSLMLGVATTLKRIDESLSEFARWLAHTGSPLVVLLVDQPDLDATSAAIERVRAKGESLGIPLIFAPYTGKSSDSEGLKNFALASVLQDAILPTTKWFGLIDDDTFFVHLPSALRALLPYDSKLPYYVGALTEGLTRVSHEGFKAWGGAGFFVSPPLMEMLASHSARCRKLDQGFGDLLWRDCILEITSPTVRLTQLAGLNQIDMWSDISGLYESGLVPLLTVHHWKSWHYHPIPLAHTVVDITGPETFLQRYLFADELVLTNGFSVAAYPKGLPDLNIAELTMVEDVGITKAPGKLEFLGILGRVRPAMKLGEEKIQWKFEFAAFGSNGRILRQFYVKRGRDGARDSVIEIDWRAV